MKLSIVIYLLNVNIVYLKNNAPRIAITIPMDATINPIEIVLKK